MSVEQPQAADAVAGYPRMIRINGNDSISINVLSRTDKDAILDFASALAEDDLLFLRVDITEPSVVENWISNVESGTTVSLVAYHGEDLVGYATVDRNLARWTRRVGEIRVNVAAAFRSKGLGRTLVAAIFDVARNLHPKKLVAHMTIDQIGAQAAFKRLGFMPEAVLADYVEDRHGHARDLVIMSYDVDGLTDQVDEPLNL
ncbi:MAG: GNAT family N-acetyltransferase [Proteobacteria bacterium]|nr:GNAT family N-acetyltransferase [Pseudomonadota bacterium]